MQAVLLHALVVLLFFGGKNVAPASRYTYFVGEVLLTCPMKYIFFEKGVYLLWKV